jgi:hypothetical protein
MYFRHQFHITHAARLCLALFTLLLVASICIKPDTLSAAQAPAGFRLPFDGGPYNITQGPGCPQFSHKLVPHAIDFSINSGTPILAAADGKIIDKIAWHKTYGGLVKIKHANNVSWYGHLKVINVHINQQVYQGQQIGLSGGDSGDFGRGYSTGAHLHFEVRNSTNRYTVPITGLPGISWNSSSYCKGKATGSPVNQVSEIAIGAGSSRQQAFQTAYNATKGYIAYGVPVSTAEWYTPNGGSRVVRQRFSNNVWLIHDEEADKNYRHTIPAYPINGAIKTYWESHGSLGAPTTNPFVNTAGQREQHFRNGYVIENGNTAFSVPWQSSCPANSPWRLEVRNVLRLPGNQINDIVPIELIAQGGSPREFPRDLPGGASVVVCEPMARDGYVLYYNRGTLPAVNNQGIWSDHWNARIQGTIANLPDDNYWQVEIACDDGCIITKQSKSYGTTYRRTLVNSWRDQAPVTLGRHWVRNGDVLDIKWYENGGAAAVWLKRTGATLSASVPFLPPTLLPDCDAQVSIDNDVSAINSLSTTLTFTGTNIFEMRVGNQEDLSDVTWQPYSPTLQWQFEPANGMATRMVYAQFRDTNRDPLCDAGTLSDDVLFDPLPPTGSAELLASDEVSATLKLQASDSVDGLSLQTDDPVVGSTVPFVAILETDSENLINDPVELSEWVWQPYSETVTVSNAPLYQIWFRDGAGNVSQPVTVEGTLVISNDQSIYLPLVIR